MTADYGVSVFPSFSATIPSDEHVSLDWEGVVFVYAGELLVTKDKAQVRYCVPCQLKAAPYVGNTAARMAKLGQTVGKQRSASHVTEARVLVFDFDELSDEQAKLVFTAVRDLGCQYIVYSSYSHGSPDKRGVRFRVVLGLDRAVGRLEYTFLWSELNTQIFDSLADPTSRHMYQQQGVWSSNPIWSQRAFRYVGHGEPLLCDRWMPSHYMRGINPDSVSRGVTQQQAIRVRQALRWIDVSQYEHWITTGSALKVLDAEAFENDWLALSASSDDPRYEPQRVWDSLKPQIPGEVAYAKLLAMARDGATATVNQCRGLAEYTNEGRAAAMYLQQNHKCHWAQLNGGH